MRHTHFVNWAKKKMHCEHETRKDFDVNEKVLDVKL